MFRLLMTAILILTASVAYVVSSGYNVNEAGKHYRYLPASYQIIIGGNEMAKRDYNKSVPQNQLPLFNQFKSISKKCSKCKTVKSVTEFYKDRQQPDGYKYSCKDCQKESVRKSYLKHKEARCAYSSKWARENKEHRKAYMAQWREKNKEHVLEYARNNNWKWTVENPEKTKQIKKKHYLANRETFIQRNKQWQKDNKEKFSANLRRYYNKHKEECLQRSSLWKKEHPQYAIVSFNKRRVKLLSCANNFTAQELIDIFNNYGNRCLSCGAKDKKLTVDHIIPISKNGDNSINNIQPLCQSCNSRKATKIIDFRYDKSSLLYTRIKSIGMTVERFDTGGEYNA